MLNQWIIASRQFRKFLGRLNEEIILKSQRQFKIAYILKNDDFMD